MSFTLICLLNHGANREQRIRGTNLPITWEPLDFPVDQIKLGWHDDSLDSNFLIDYVPGKKGLMVTSGGMAPNIIGA